ASGDLACADAAGNPAVSPGAVGMVTWQDRGAAAIDLQRDNLLQTCVADLSRAPSATALQDPGTQCVNLGKVVAAIRLLTTGGTASQGRGTRADHEPRARGLLVRLTQQWAMLHGFVASTGLSQIDYDVGKKDSLFTASSARDELIALLNRLDRGWGA